MKFILRQILIWRIPTKRDVKIPQKWNLPKAQWHTQDVLQTPSCPFPGTFSKDTFSSTLYMALYTCIGWFFNLFRPKFRAKKKNVAQPRRIFCTSRISWNRISDWLSIVFHFGTENWADQLKKPPCISCISHYHYHPHYYLYHYHYHPHYYYYHHHSHHYLDPSCVSQRAKWPFRLLSPFTV